MRLRQEQVVFLLGLALLGLLSFGLFRDAGVTKRPSRGAAGDEELERHVVPEVETALADPGLAIEGRRSLFAPPRDTRPLPPLELVEPPREPFVGLMPPTDPGPAVAAWGTLLRRTTPLEPTEGLFEGLIDPLGGTTADDAFFGVSVPDGGSEPVESSGGGLADSRFEDESTEERAVRIDGYRARYDWIALNTGPMQFGRIENEDRLGLLFDTDRATEALLFVEVDPETGVEVFRSTGSVALEINRGVIREFGFARTVPNELALRDRSLGSEVTRGSYDERMAFAGWCVEHRLDADEALPTARRVYRSLARFDPDDPDPRLGLARALEANFDFDGALLEYEALVQDFPLVAAVQVGLAELEERLLLFEEAEARLMNAVRIERGSWEALSALGGFLHRRGRDSEALEHLQAADRAAPKDPSALRVRVDIRNELGSVLLALGDVEGAARVFRSALNADAEDQRALAGSLIALVLSDPEHGGTRALAQADAAGVESPGFELALARGLAAVASGEGALAEAEFTTALALDPLRASLPLAALAFVAEGTGYPEEALELADRALEAHPSNAYGHYLRGRLLGQRDDYEGSRAALLAALEVELDFEDALAAMGEMGFRLGRFEDAERYLERAVELSAEAGRERPEVHALRGLNLLRLGRVGAARASFRAARAVDFSDPVAQAGLAWCTYLGGDATEALVQLADLDESRRDQPEDDPWRLWAREQQERIAQHVAKEEWFDALNRKDLKNGWLTDERDGPTVRMQDGAVRIEGAFQRAGRARVFRQEAGGLFVSFEASVWVDPTNTRAGIFIAHERPRAGSMEITDEVSVSRHKDGSTQVRLVRSRQKPEEIDMESSFPTGRWVRLAIEREGEGSDTRITVSMDGVPLIENVRATTIGSGSSALLMGLFVEGEVGREASVRMEDVSVVRRIH